MPSYILLFWVPQYWYFCTCPILPSHFFLDTASLIFCKFPRCDQKEYSASNSSNTIIYALLCTLLIFTSFPPLNSTLCLPLSIQSLSLSIQQIETYSLFGVPIHLNSSATLAHENVFALSLIILSCIVSMCLVVHHWPRCQQRGHHLWRHFFPVELLAPAFFSCCVVFSRRLMCIDIYSPLFLASILAARTWGFMVGSLAL